MSAQRKLSAPEFIQMLQYGHQSLRNHVAQVNALNVFPVPDGDTGTNMELSLSAGIGKLGEFATAPLEKVCQAFAAGLLMGARGNSGVILSQLFRGFLKVSQGQSQLDVPMFAAGLQDGVQIAYRAVQKPVEGTILTVAREAAAVGQNHLKQATSLADWMEKVYEAALQALERTPEQLKVLKQAGVVDSGGRGLCFIYEGFLQFLSGQTERLYSIPAPLDARMSSQELSGPRALHFAAADMEHRGEHGYCTELLLRIEKRQDVERVEESLRDSLQALGDSLLVVGIDDMVKVHVHTLHPGTVLEEALQSGVLLKVKVDNMTEQHDEIIRGALLGSDAPVMDKATVRNDDTDMPFSGDENHDMTSPSSWDALAGRARGTAETAVIAVAAGHGLREIFTSLGAERILEGGQTMNPSTEDIVNAIIECDAKSVIFLPNNKNIVMAAEQARDVVGNRVHVVGTRSIPEGIAALMAFLPGRDVDTNATQMTAAASTVRSGHVVRAVRDSIYEDHEIKNGQYLGFVDSVLRCVEDNRLEALTNALVESGVTNAELVTVIYGEDVPEEELQELSTKLQEYASVELEIRSGGQPVYDYIYSLE